MLQLLRILATQCCSRRLVPHPNVSSIVFNEQFVPTTTGVDDSLDHKTGALASCSLHLSWLATPYSAVSLHLYLYNCMMFYNEHGRRPSLDNMS